MTHIYKFIFSFIFFACFFTSYAGDIRVTTGASDLKIKQNTYSEIIVSNTFTELTYQNVQNRAGSFTELYIPDYGLSNKIGEPQLPVLKRLIEIPIDAVPQVDIIHYTMKEYSLSEYGILNKIIPAQPSVSKDTSRAKPTFKYNENTYFLNQYNTDELVSVIPIGIMRNVRLARLEIAPVRYNPVTNTIQVYYDIEFKVRYEGADISKTIELKQNTQSVYFEDMFNTQLLNYQKPPVLRDTLTKYPVKYVIVSDPMFKSTLQPFIAWKKKKGFNVIEAYTDNSAVGTTTTKIKAYLKGLYDAGTPSDPAPSFVLFVGDIAQVPAFNGTGDGGGHVTDLYYCEYTNDYIPEMYYGRFSATSTTQLQPQIDKTLEYEQYTMSDPSFLGKCVMISGQDDDWAPKNGDGQINYGTSTYFNTAHNLTSSTYLYAVSGSSATTIRQKVSDGVCFANYTAHGSSSGWYDPSFTTSHVSSMTNNHKFPLMVGNCCLTSKYDDSSCFGEALLRASGKGALGYIGASNSSYWDEDFWFAVGYKTVVVNPTYKSTSLGAYDRVFHDHGETISNWYATMDQMVFAGNLAVSQSGTSSEQYYWEIYCLMGDPSLMIYFGVPTALTATYNQLLTGQTTFTVQTDAYAYVAISKNNELYGAALADSTGLAVLTITPFTANGTADVVVTKQNKSPFIGTISIGTVSCKDYNISNNILVCYPSPAKDFVSIDYIIEKTTNVSIKLYDMMGQEISTIVNEKNANSGSYNILFKVENLNSGVYFCNLISDNKIISKKLIVSK